jgi:hypothetical protein
LAALRRWRGAIRNPEEGEMEKEKPGRKANPKKQATLGIALGAFVVVALALVLILSGEDNSPGSSGGVEVLSAAALREAVSGTGTPVYWAGEQAGTEIELSQPEAGRTYVRYLTDGAKAGDPRPIFLTVGTYDRPHPAQELRRQGKSEGAVLAEAPGGAVVYYDRRSPQSVYLAYPGVKAQIEVYDPDVKQALRLVNSGQIVAVG